MQKFHHLKTWPEFFEQVRLGQKPFEIRRDDRGFESGDVVVLEEWNPDTKQYTGRSEFFLIGALVKASWVGLQEGFCAFGLLPICALELRRATDGGTPPLPKNGASDKAEPTKQE